MVVCKYNNVYSKSPEYALVAKNNIEGGNKEVLSMINKPNVKGQEYEGVNCYTPKVSSVFVGILS